MTIYLSTIIVILIFGFIYSSLEGQTQRPYRKKYIIAVSILLILQSGLRNWAVGADTYQYYLHFEAVKRANWANIQHALSQYYRFGLGKDPGYDIIQKIVQYVLPHYQLFLVFIAIIFFSALGNFIYKNTTRISDSVFAYVLYSCLFFSFFSITGQRQTLATAAALYGYELVKRKKPLLFFLLILFASSIHKSVLIFIPFYYISRLQKTGLLYWSAFLLFPVLMTYKITFFKILQEVGGYKNYGIYETAGTYTFSLMLLLVATVSLWRMRIALWQNNAIRPVYNAFIFALLFTPLTWVHPAAMRVVQYYSIFMLLLVPALINSFEFESKKIRRVAYIVSLCLLILLFINGNIHREYKFFWQEMALGGNYRWQNF